MVVQQPNTGQTATRTNYSSKQEAIKGEYNTMEQICPIGTFMPWALLGWVIILLGCIAWCVVGLVIIAVAAACVGTEFEGDTTETATNVLCSVGIALGVVILILGLYELCITSLIIHGIRSYQYGLCIFACIWAGIGLLGCWAVVGNVAYVSVTGFILYGLTLGFTVGMLYY